MILKHREHKWWAACPSLRFSKSTGWHQHNLVREVVYFLISLRALVV
jgi:hypothetical protein